jgi:hypothetical protein
MRNPARALVILLSAHALWSCFSSGRFTELPAADQDAFQRCREVMRPALCGPDPDLVYVTNCIRSNMSRYAEAPAGDGRAEWLLAHGCPPSMVSPSAYVVSSGGTRESAVRGTAPAQTPSATAEARPPNTPARADVLSAMRRVQQLADSCLPIGVFGVRLTYAGDGTILLVQPHAGDVPDSVLTCIREQARAVPLPRFLQQDFTVVYEFSHM